MHKILTKLNNKQKFSLTLPFTYLEFCSKHYMVSDLKLLCLQIDQFINSFMRNFYIQIMNTSQNRTKKKQCGISDVQSCRSDKLIEFNAIIN